MGEQKIIYCKKCGSPIDPSKKCTGCGKQYFNPKIFKSKCFSVLLILFCICTTVLSGYLYHLLQEQIQETNQKKEFILEQNEKYIKLENEYQKSQEQIRKLEDKNFLYKLEKQSLNTEVLWYESYAGIVTSSGDVYHKYGCYHINDSESFWIYNVSQAEALGYRACYDCH